MRSICALVVCFCVCAVFGEEEKAVNDPEFHKPLLEIAACYERFGRVDDGMRWAPWLCDAPGPSVARVSAAKGREGHGGKLYFVFASQREQYLRETESSGYNRERRVAGSKADEKPVNKDEQKKVESALLAKLGKSEGVPAPGIEKLYVAVKESWLPEEWNGGPIPSVSKRSVLTESDKIKIRKGGAAPEERETTLDHVAGYAEKDNKKYVLGERGPLFIMYRTEKNTPGTDNGWVYGTLTPDGKTVTSAGRVASCMGCHTEAPYPKEPKCEGRLFGLPEKVKKKEN
jgi:hypothetical protein